MYAIFDKNRNDLNYDQWGHLRVYGNKDAAHRKAEDQNRAVYPKMDRYVVIETRVSY